jgi:hypothetical protein
MLRFIDCFVALGNGEWFCRHPVTVRTPAGSVGCTPGVTYRVGRSHNAVDVGSVLEEYATSGHLPRDVSFTD